MHEGGAEYERGIWDPLDLMTVRDAAVADIIPRMSQMEGYGDFGSPRLVYNLGHALYEFIEARWGKDGVRQFLFSLRKSAIGGGSSPYEEAFQMSAREFDQQFEKYLKDRFKAFRDKERPADYGQDLSPDPEKSRLHRRHLDRAVALGRPHRDGHRQSPRPGARHHPRLGERRRRSSGTSRPASTWIAGSNTSRIQASAAWCRGCRGRRSAIASPTSCARRSTRRSSSRTCSPARSNSAFNIQSVDNPESPNISPDGRTRALQRPARRDRRYLPARYRQRRNHEPHQRRIRRLRVRSTRPTAASSSIWRAISGSQKLFRLDIGTGKKTQLTFGTQDEAAAKFLNADTLIFSSTATDPATPLTPEVARNGNIFNLWSLSLKNGELRQYTDALGGVLSPVVLSKDGATPKLAFVDYYKGSYSLHTFDLKEPLHTAASADFGSPGPIVDFQAPLQHTLVAENKSKKGRFDKMFLDGRPPVNVGVTSGGDVFGGSMVSFTDVLGDQQFSMYASSVQQVQDAVVLVRQPVAALPVRAAGLLADAVLLRPARRSTSTTRQIAPFIRREDALATQTVRGGSMFGIYPFSTYRRVELSGGIVHFAEEYADPLLQSRPTVSAGAVRNAAVQQRHDGAARRVVHPGDDGVPRVRPAVGQHRCALSFEGAPKVGNSLSRQTVDADARYYMRLGANGVFAVRAYGFKSWGDAPGYTYFGGNSEMRGYDYRAVPRPQGRSTPTPSSASR